MLQPSVVEKLPSNNCWFEQEIEPEEYIGK